MLVQAVRLLENLELLRPGRRAVGKTSASWKLGDAITVLWPDRDRLIDWPEVQGCIWSPPSDLP